MAGVSRLQYSNEIRIIRVMCTGRVDFDHVIKTFLNGVDGVFIVGCRLGECNYNTAGNYHSLNLVFILKRLMEQIELDPERLRIEFMSSSEGQHFAEFANDFVKKIKEIGPLGKGEGESKNTLNIKLEAIMQMVPYLRLVEGERLRAHFNTMEEYEEFYSSEGFKKVFRELIAEKLAISQIMLLLREKSLSTAEICETLDLFPAELSKYMNNSVKQGLARYEETQKRYVFAFI